MAVLQKTYQDKVADKDSDSFSPGTGTFVLSQWFVGTEKKDGSNVKCELWWDQKGNGKSLKFIDRIFTSKATYQKTLNLTFTATATSKLIVKRLVEGKKGPREVFLRWQGTLN